MGGLHGWVAWVGCMGGVGMGGVGMGGFIDGVGMGGLYGWCRYGRFY